MCEIGPLFNTCLNKDVIYNIYNKLVHLKTLNVKIKEDILTYNVINFILDSMNLYIAEKHNLYYIHYTINMFNMIRYDKAIEYDDTNVRRSIMKTFLKYTPQTRKEYFVFMVDYGY